jgi:hypothetical protein
MGFILREDGAVFTKERSLSTPHLLEIRRPCHQVSGALFRTKFRKSFCTPFYGLALQLISTVGCWNFKELLRNKLSFNPGVELHEVLAVWLILFKY